MKLNSKKRIKKKGYYYNERKGRPIITKFFINKDVAKVEKV
jgi:hypothetical protein